MAEDLATALPATTEQSSPAALEPAAPAPAEDSRPLVERPRAPRQPKLYRRRFLLAYLALALIGLAGVAATAALFVLPRTQESEEWSTWRPTGDEDTYVDQIADYVSGRYRQPTGSALVAVLAGRPEVKTADAAIPLDAVAIQPEGGEAADDIEVVRIDKSVMYTLCGLGPQCAMAEGPPSAERHRLLRREALELALYTFKYTDRRSVLALLPPRIEPGPNGEAQVVSATALFFQEDDLDEALDRPLSTTLVAEDPPQATQIPAEEVSTIDSLTEERLFDYQFTQTQQGAAIMVLAHVDT